MINSRGTSRIAVTGIWHQGMVLAAGLSSLGHDVVGLAVPDAVEKLAAGEPLLHEPGVAEALRAGIDAGLLRFTSDPVAALSDAAFVYVSTDTPVDEVDAPVLDDVFALAELAGLHAPPTAVLVVTAQVPVGTTDRLAEVSGLRAAYVPEFLQLGVALETFVKADRVVVGADDDEVGDEVEGLYVSLGRPMVRTSIRTAEMAKHASNALLATEVSFANELGDLCETVGADVHRVAEILRLDHRFGPHAYLSAGLGFSGATLGRDLRVLQAVGTSESVPTPLLDAVLDVNASRPGRVVTKLQSDLGSLEGAAIALFGLTYKAGTSTLRRAISLDIATQLVEAGAVVTGFDPLADATELGDSPPLTLVRSPYEAAAGADGIVYLTDWKDRHELDLQRLRGLVARPTFLDTRGDFDPAQMSAHGFRYLRVPEGES